MHPEGEKSCQSLFPLFLLEQRASNQKSINRTFKEHPPLFHFGGNSFPTRTIFFCFVLVLVLVLVHPRSCVQDLTSAGLRMVGLCESATTWQKSREAKHASPTPPLRPDCDNQVSFWIRRWLDLTFILFLLHFFFYYDWSMYLMCPLIGRWNYTYYIIGELQIIKKNSHYYDCHRNEWLLPHLARLYLHTVFRKQS